MNVKPHSPASGFTLIEIMVVVAIIGLIVSVALPNFLRSRTNAQRQVCIENLSQLESAKQLWGLENGKNEEDVPVTEDLVGDLLYLKTLPICPAGGEYGLRSIAETAMCNIEGHTLE